MTPLGVLGSEVHRCLLGELAVQVAFGVAPAHLQCALLPMTQSFFSDPEAANAANYKRNSPSVPGTLTAPQPHSRCLLMGGSSTSTQTGARMAQVSVLPPRCPGLEVWCGGATTPAPEKQDRCLI